MEKIGFIGLGNLGENMAKNIQKAGYPMVVLDNRKEQEKELVQDQLNLIDQRIRQCSAEDPLAFWDKQEWMIRLPALPINAPMKASHPGMSLEDTELCKQEIQDLLAKDLIEPSHSHWGCVAFYVNKHSE